MKSRGSSDLIIITKEGQFHVVAVHGIAGSGTFIRYLGVLKLLCIYCMYFLQLRNLNVGMLELICEMDPFC